MLRSYLSINKLFILAIPCLALLPSAAFPADLQPVAALPPGTTTVALTELQSLKLENADLKYSLAVKQAQEFAQERAAILTAVCSDLKLTDCQFDTRNRTATGAIVLRPESTVTGHAHVGPLPNTLEAPATGARNDPPRPAGRSNPK